MQHICVPINTTEAAILTGKHRQLHNRTTKTTVILTIEEALNLSSCYEWLRDRINNVLQRQIHA